MRPDPCPPDEMPRARTKDAWPVRKVTAGTLSGALAVLIVALIESVIDKPLPTAVGESLVVVIGFMASYITPPKVGEVVVDCEERE